MKTTLRLGLGSALVAPLLLVTYALCAASFGCSSPVAGNRPIDAGMDVGMDRPHVMPVDAYCAADAMGGGVCPFNFCGQLLSVATVPANGYPQSGADSLCNDGRVCVVGPVLAAGDGFQLSCKAPTTSIPLAFGAACSPDPAQGMRCANDSLCVASADFSGQPFCSTLCRNDADCPNDARCLEYATAGLPNGSHAEVGMCTPASKIAGTPCTHEGDCLATEGCMADGARTGLNICRATTATKSVGQACAGASECRSGACYDRIFKLKGTQNRAYCSAVCGVNSHCGPDQVCARLVQNTNGTTSDPTDDVVIGICQSLFVPVASSGCGIDADCTALQNGSDTCDATHGLCYRKSALPGSACTIDTGCQLGGVCSTGARFPGGYCQTTGCDPAAATGVDACAGAASVCASRGGPDAPLNACYEGCSTTDAGNTCSRAATGFDCEPIVSGGPPTLCLAQGGT